MQAVRTEAAGTAPAGAGAEKTAVRRTAAAGTWTRVLGVAAAFVFLIGGTILHRNSKQSMNAAAPTVQALPAAGTETPEPARTALPAAVYMEEAAEEAVEMEAAEMTADMAYAPAEEADAGIAQSGADSMALKAERAAGKGSGYTLQANGAAPEAPVSVGGVTAGSSFLEDMGEFLLAALPYLAVLAVPALIALVLRRRKKRT